jgi:predicted Zn-dependent peptidase
MIHFSEFTLNNGLKVIHHRDESTPLVVMNILYKVGARNEAPNKTGFAHLFEHLMFGGSINIPEYDRPLQLAGGENNAFTNNDITNYYLTLPAQNIETGFWLESDRMLSLAFSNDSLEIQRSVVIEEFKQRYLNQPYGDVWLKLRPLAYKVHPYRWPTIGKEIAHIENATLNDVKAFFKNHYCPNNAIMCVAGNITLERVKKLSEKWFGPIPPQPVKLIELPAEPAQEKERKKTVSSSKVPADALYMAFHSPGRRDSEYYAADLLTDILSRGRSSRLLNSLVKEQKLFSEIGAYITGDVDPGLIVIEGKVNQGVSSKNAKMGIRRELNKLMSELVSENELNKVKTKVESTIVFGEMGILNKGMALCYATFLGNTNLVNEELDLYQNVSSADIKQTAIDFLDETNCSTLNYLTEKA